MIRTIAAVVAGVAATAALGLSAASASATPARGSADAYGYTTVRDGVPDTAKRFTLTSPDVRQGAAVPADAWANAFGCTSTNHQPRLAWSGAPAGTRSYAVTMVDRDAPTGGGFRHWLVWDVPTGTTALDRALPPGAVSGTNDAGLTGYLGPCPPPGDVTHRYEITVYALDVADLGLPASTPAAVTSFTMSSHVVGYARITATARR